jgi:hypothetical protein
MVSSSIIRVPMPIINKEGIVGIVDDATGLTTTPGLFTPFEHTPPHCPPSNKGNNGYYNFHSNTAMSKRMMESNVRNSAAT